MPTLICDCNKTMPLQEKTLGAALGENLTLHSSLCRREAGDFQSAIRSGGDVVVACTQEKRLFAELGGNTEGAVSPIRFVNIRETGGWSADAPKAMPKIAALLAAAHLPEPEPVPVVTYKSAGRLVIIGELDDAERAAAMLADVLDITLFTQGGAGAQERRYPVLGGRIDALAGWLGAFELKWTRDNAIDLDLCTRCNACVVACPEQAIGLDYQVDMDKCTSHRACVQVCEAAGAIDFDRPAQAFSEAFHLVLDLRAEAAFRQHAPPQGYFHVPDPADPRSLSTLLELRGLVGEFEKPKFFQYKQKLCAHSRNETVGCNACIDVCSAEAISSEKSRQQVKVNPNLCVGCGACTTVCPTGALTFAYPRAGEQGDKLRTLLGTYAKAGGRDAVVLLHSHEKGRELVEALGRAAQLKRAAGVPAHVIPVPVWHTASIGLDVWLSAIALGATQVAVLAAGEEAPQYLQALRAQMDVADAILNGLGYAGSHFRLIQARTVPALDQELVQLAAHRPRAVATPARFALAQEKRATLELAIDHLVEHAPQRADAIALPAAGSPFGAIEVDKDKCTLCLSCVGACPSNALLDNPQLPQLRMVEKNCVQCGLCEQTCPEDAITLVPRLLTTPQRKEPRVLNETQPYGCIRCGKPFGTLKAIEAMLGKLAGHSMFQGAALERLKMCGDCRVIDIHSSTDETKITDL
ncbi:4Fe-4S binding protein [Caenimonas aquaedulcis]|uniref:4Fe-4S binding protein n=1 Tax=Caenimonas aquaedulcis TaxID=2793270 RepID=A0A931MGJ2_9BURK|nr:4Fe-4S binding protein [Caenimonas aquaedulcis]MBG9388097.1 4Fe-4S binding protein [Caenimonas aquaedulcis]